MGVGIFLDTRWCGRMGDLNEKGSANVLPEDIVFS